MRETIHHVNLVVSLLVETLVPLQEASLELTLCLIGTTTRPATKLPSQIYGREEDANANKSTPGILLAASRRREREKVPFIAVEPPGVHQQAAAL
ncbi:hypothetical protein CEP53_003219 [Fusarium sp. AF-6]|nr:hypothetical protein CEP53_003219 [Fusarium sp. AF-6]